MTVTVFGIRNCDTVRKARNWLDAKGIAYRFHDFKADGIGRIALQRWCDILGWESVINRSGTTFRSWPDPDKQGLDVGKAIALMMAQPSMIKRPIVEAQGILVAGFKPEAYAASFA